MALCWARLGIMTAAAIAIAFGVALRPDSDAMREDGPIEAASAMIFAAAAAIGFLRVFRGPDAAVALTILSSAALLAALDELSFGARHLGWEPHRLAGVPIDGAHDLLAVAWRLLQWSPKWLKAAALATALVGTVAAAWMVWRFRRRIDAAWSRADQPLIATAAAAAVVVAAAQLMDVAPSSALGARLGALEEALELAGALLTLAATAGLANRLSEAAAVR